MTKFELEDSLKYKQEKEILEKIYICLSYAI